MGLPVVDEFSGLASLAWEEGIEGAHKLDGVLDQPTYVSRREGLALAEIANEVGEGLEFS